MAALSSSFFRAKFHSFSKEGMQTLCKSANSWAHSAITNPQISLVWQSSNRKSAIFIYTKSQIRKFLWLCSPLVINPKIVHDKTVRIKHLFSKVRPLVGFCMASQHFKPIFVRRKHLRKFLVRKSQINKSQKIRKSQICNSANFHICRRSANQHMW